MKLAWYFYNNYQILLRYVNQTLDSIKIQLSELSKLKTEEMVMLASLLGGFIVPMDKWKISIYNILMYLDPKTPEANVFKSKSYLRF
jgi:helix-turn-helix protein